MSQPVSPGVYFREIDLSTYTLRLSTTILGIVGTSQKGPINTPTLITNAASLTSKFGLPHPNHLSMYAALQFLRYGNQLMFVRVNGSTASLASASQIDGDIDAGFLRGTASGPFTFNALAGAVLTGTVSETYNIVLNTNDKVLLVINDESPVTITLTAGGARTAAEVAGEIDTAISALGAGAADNGGVVEITTTGTGANQTIQALPVTNDAYTTLGFTTTQQTGSNGNQEFTLIELERSALGATPVEIEQAMTLTGSSQTVDQVVTQMNTAITGGTAIATVTGTVAETYNIVLDTNDKFKVKCGGTSVTVTLTAGGTQSASDVATDIDALLPAGYTADVNVDKVRISSDVGGHDQSIEIETVTNDAYTTLGFTVGTTAGTGIHATVANVSGRIQVAAASSGQNAGIKVKTFHSAGSNSAFLGFTNNQRAWGYGVSPTAETFSVDAANVGTWGNDLKVTIADGAMIELSSSAAVPGSAGRWVRTFDLTVTDGDTVVETYTDLAIYPDDVDVSQGVHYFADKINPEYQGAVQISGSKYIKVTDVVDNTGLPTTGDYLFTGGDDGLESVGDDEYVGTINGNTRTGLELFADPERYDVNLLICPGVHSAAVINKLLSVSIGRGDCMCIVDPPFDLDVQQVIDWHNGAGVYNDHQAYNSSYGALYYSWHKEYDPNYQQFVWTPPSGFVAAVYAYNDQQGEVWYAPAGVNRGRIIEAVDIRYSPDQGERDAMYGNRNAINPIPAFQREGITVWGQRTLQRKPTSLDRVNVRRLVLYIRKVLATVYRTIVFEPNDERTWRQIVALTEPFLKTIVARRGIEEFDVVCDSTTNTPETIDNNELHVVILIDPTQAAERIHVDITLTRTGAVFEETTRELAGVV